MPVTSEGGKFLAGLSEEQGRRLIAEVVDARQAMDATLALARVVLGPEGGDVTRELEAHRDRLGSISAEMQTLVGPEERGPAVVRQLRPRRERGAHRK